MGIKHLNKFLIQNCTHQESIYHNAPLSEFRGKVLVVDASIYIYKFLEEKALIENMYLFVSILKHHEIIPVFVFDGKSPPEKKDLLASRRLKKKEAEKTYLELSAKEEEDDSADALTRLELLRKQFIRMTNENIQATKDLLRACGIHYYEAEGEADALCVHMVLQNKAWACISEDMDMFVYGCPRVIRNISMTNQTCMYYCLESILGELDMGMEHFRQITVLSGTDYNINETTDLTETLNWYYEYKKQIAKDVSRGKDATDFYEWLFKNTKYVSDFEFLQRVYGMFVLDTENFPEIEDGHLCVRPNDEPALNAILEKEGFLI